MTERFVAPFARFFTSDIKTLPGAKLYFYENGTTTLKAVYQDPFNTNEHTNPVIADSAGNFPAIFIDGTYTVELKSAAEITQTGWPYDNVGGEQIEGQFDSWSAITSYPIGQLVTGSDGNRYESTANGNLNRDPTNPANRTAYWKQVFIIGDYVSTETYGVGDYVTHDGGLFKCVQAATGQNPNTAHAYWQRIHNIPHWGSTATYRQYDLVIGSNGVVQVSQQNTNLNHNPVGDSGAWWQPFSIQKGVTLSGGGTMSRSLPNFFTDSSTYTLPAANSLPADSVVFGIKQDRYRTAQPIVQRAGSDTITNATGATDTSIQYDYGYKTTVEFKTDGISNWSI